MSSGEEMREKVISAEDFIREYCTARGDFSENVVTAAMIRYLAELYDHILGRVETLEKHMHEHTWERR